jgi:transcription termination factor Rho
MMFLVDERPEEVTHLRRNVTAEVIASTFDESPQRHVHVSERVAERARSWVDSGHDVIVFMDSLTRLGRAYNNVARTTGRILSGGLESNALQRPKRFFGSARTGRRRSLTILATASSDQLAHDEVIFEFKGTGNMEIVLSRSTRARIFPAIDLNKSGMGPGGTGEVAARGAGRPAARGGRRSCCSSCAGQDQRQFLLSLMAQRVF